MKFLLATWKVRDRITPLKISFRIVKDIARGKGVRKMIKTTVDLNDKIWYNTAISNQQSAISNQVITFLR
jgi:hypothetical protein